LIYGAVFNGLTPPNITFDDIKTVRVEIYRVFPNDSDTTRTPTVPTRTDTPADVVFLEPVGPRAERSTKDGTLGYTFVTLLERYPVATSIIDGINPVPGQASIFTSMHFPGRLTKDRTSVDAERCGRRVSRRHLRHRDAVQVGGSYSLDAVAKKGTVRLSPSASQEIQGSHSLILAQFST
jgi:hypothetical protein